MWLVLLLVLKCSVLGCIKDVQVVECVCFVVVVDGVECQLVALDSWCECLIMMSVGLFVVCDVRDALEGCEAQLQCVVRGFVD